MRIVKTTGCKMVRCYGAHTDARTWQEDIPGNDVLPSGASVVIDFDDGTGYCVFDFRAVFSDGDAVEVYDKNVCELGTFTFNP